MSNTPGYIAARRARLRAAHKCTDCAKARPRPGCQQCVDCATKDRKRSKRRTDRYRHALSWFVPSSQLSAEALYQAVRHEREQVSWCWRNPA